MVFECVVENIVCDELEGRSESRDDLSKGAKAGNVD